MNHNYHKYIIILGILTLWLVGIPLLFLKAVPVICENLSYNTAYNISIQNPKLYLNVLPTATIKADNIIVSSKNSQNEFFIKNLKLKLRILPLLSGKIHINQIESSAIEVKTTLNTQAKLDKNFISDIQKTKIKCNNIKIDNLILKIKQTEPFQEAAYIGKNILYKKSGNSVKFNIESCITLEDKISHADANIFLPGNNNVSKSIFDIHINNFNIEPLCNYFKNYLPNELTDAKGIVNIDIDKQNFSARFHNLKILMKDNAKSMIFPEELNIKSGFNLTRKSIIINDAEISSKNINTVINGTVSNYTNELPAELNLNIRINKSAIEDFINMSPPFKTEDIDMYKLKKYKFYGNILGNFNIKGALPEPSINGNIFVNDGILTKPIPHAKGATVKLDFKGRTLNFDVLVPAGEKEKVFVNGDVELYNIKYANMHVWSTKNVDLETAEEKVVPIHEILNFIIGPVPIMDIKGNGNIDILIKGNRKNPHVWGYLNFYNVTTHFIDIPDLILTNADATLKFNDEDAVFNLQKGVINNHDVSINGTCNLAGKFDFDVKTANQNLSKLYSIIQSSSLINELKNMIPPMNISQGIADLQLKVYGSIKDILLIKYNENFFIKGNLNIKNSDIDYNKINLHNTNGEIKFDNTNADININAHLGQSPLILKALVKGQIIDADISIPQLNLKDIVDKSDKYIQDFANIIVNVKAKYKGKTDNIEYEKVNFSADIIDVLSKKLKISNGSVILKNNKLQIKNMNGSFEENYKSSFNINIEAENITSSPVITGTIKLKDFELFIINTFSECSLVPKEIKDAIKQIHFNKGKINLNAVISKNNVNASTDIGGIEFTYVPLNLPFKVINGSIYLRKSFLGLNKINLMVENMPILIDGGINNVFSKQDFNLYINSKPKQDFIDKYINTNRIYPLKVKGDIVYNAKIKGIKDNFRVISEALMEKDSSIYYLGATVGDIENSIILNLDMNVVKQNLLNIKEFSYDKLISSQNSRKTKLNMLKANGEINILKNDALFQDFRIKTNNPTNAGIFNIFFRKPIIKQGQFTSDLKINGKMSDPHITGTFRIVETNIPFFDTTMKTLSLIFKDKTIEILSNGEILGNDVKLQMTLKNKLIPPFYIENAELYTKIIDLNYITNKLKRAQAEENNAIESFGTFDFKNTIIKKIKLNANEIKLRNLTAEKVEATASLTEHKNFNINHFKFNIANGNLNGSLYYNMINNKMGLKINTENINANDISIALFDLNNQIYGDLTGKLKLSCDGSEFNQCMQTLDGNVEFNVKNGKMPKLGSLEYLLKAGNLIKGGLTGISVNSVIDILTPLKTGNFSNIYGTMDIAQGVSNNIEISTKGNDLSLFITGKYNFATSNAEMEVLGILSKKISTMFGPLGNVSINTLFNVIPGIDLAKDSKILDNINKIPGIELNEKAFRKFIAEIQGDINSDNYVKSFKWIN